VAIAPNCGSVSGFHLIHLVPLGAIFTLLPVCSLSLLGPNRADIDVNPARIDGIGFMMRELDLIHVSQTSSHP
jgi:hypothetical protein